MRRKNAATEFLKECMADALLKLLDKKSIDEITVSEITETASVARVTYYRHFNSKEELLYFKCHLIGERWYNGLTEEQKKDTVFLTVSFFELTASLKELLLTLFRANLYHIVLLALYNAMREEAADASPEDAAYSTAFLSFGMFGILTEWIRSGCKQTPEELAELTLQNVRKPDPR